MTVPDAPPDGVAGTLHALWRYPVKSMQGEQVDDVSVDARGLCGDRAYAVLDAETGLVASAKHPGRWGALIRCRAAYVERPRAGEPPPPVRITLPDGAAVVRSDDPRVDAVLTRALGRAVRLTTVAPVGARREADRTPAEDGATTIVREEPLALAAPADSFFDVAPVHLLTTATLAELARRAPASRFDVRRFRPNLVVATEDVGAIETRWIGRTLRIEADVRLAVVDPSPRCVVTTLAQGDLPRDPAVLRALARGDTVASHTLAPGARFPAVAGVYAQVRGGGVLARGAPVRVG